MAMAVAAVSAFGSSMHVKTSLAQLAVSLKGMVRRSRTKMVLNDASTEGKALKKAVSKVELRTLSGCVLGVSWFPDIVYNAQGGGSVGYADEVSDGRIAVRFNKEDIYIPPLCYSTATFLGLPIPPPLSISIKPQLLEGTVDLGTGAVEIKFVANFFFSAGSLYRAPPLLVDTLLTTEYSESGLRSGQGSKLNDDGYCRLVGTAPLAKTKDLFLDVFLSLPTDCLANMSAQIQFS